MKRNFVGVGFVVSVVAVLFVALSARSAYAGLSNTFVLHGEQFSYSTDNWSTDSFSLNANAYGPLSVNYVSTSFGSSGYYDVNTGAPMFNITANISLMLSSAQVGNLNQGLSFNINDVSINESVGTWSNDIDQNNSGYAGVSVNHFVVNYGNGNLSYQAPNPSYEYEGGINFLVSWTGYFKDGYDPSSVFGTGPSGISIKGDSLPVPEPASLGILAIGVSALLMRRRLG